MEQCCANLSVQPSRGLMDEKLLIVVKDVLPGSQLTLHALHKSEDGHTFAHYTANAIGTVNISEDPSLGGTYSGVEPMGLLWSLRPVEGSKLGLRLREMDVQTPMEVFISVYQGQQTIRFMDQVPLGIVLVERWYMAPGVCRFPVIKSGLTGTIFLPPGRGPFPGIIDLWGGGGLLVECRAALLASHGFASLALEYLEIPNEKGKMVDIEYFEVGRLQCPLLLVVGEDDQNWPAYESAMDMNEIMERAGNSHLLTTLVYPNTGHLIEPPYTPHTRTSIFRLLIERKMSMILWGGELVSHSHAQEDAWRKTLHFLWENLYCNRSLASQL